MMPPLNSQSNHRCTLCQKLAERKNHPDFIFDAGPNVSVFKSPFSKTWPGALTIIFFEHIYEQSEIYSGKLRETMYALISCERALKKVTHCNRINFAKFGNQEHHLHWHIIPRYREEVYKEKSTWELLELDKEALFQTDIDRVLGDENILLAKVKKEALYHLNNATGFFYGSAFFLRPREEAKRGLLQEHSLERIVSMARSAPDQWECLLMKRNYLDFAWDHVGGNNNAREFPKQTMLREVQEELGWKIKDSIEICREWRSGFLKGFMYAAMPTEPNYALDTPPYVPCQEVQKIQFFGLLDLASHSMFSASVRGRTKAFLEGQSDFHTEVH